MVSMEEALTAQVAVLGSLLLEPKLIGPVLDKVGAEDFLSDRCREVFFALRSLFTAGEAVDPVTVRAKLGGGGDWDRFLLELMEVTPTAANVWEYVALMRRQARLARVNELGGALQAAGDLDTCRACADQLNASLADRPGVRCVTMEQALLAFYDRQSTPRDYLSWGLGKLDDCLYVEPGDLVILGGYSSAGKTALALRFAWHMACQGRRVGFFSLETGDRKLFDRLVATAVGLNFGRIKRGGLTEQDYQTLAGSVKALIAPPLELVDAACMSVDDIRAYALSRRYEVVFVDYLQIISTSGSTFGSFGSTFGSTYGSNFSLTGAGGSGYGSRSGSTFDSTSRSNFSPLRSNFSTSRSNFGSMTETVSRISIALHQFSQGCGIAVVALSQLSRPEKGPQGTIAPTMHSLRESGQIEQDADVVMLLYKEFHERPGSRRVLKIAKNKEGGTGRVLLDFDGDTQTFRPVPGAQDPDDA